MGTRGNKLIFFRYWYPKSGSIGMSSFEWDIDLKLIPMMKDGFDAIVKKLKSKNLNRA